MQKIRYPSLAQAIGAFVAGEFEACQCEPARLMLDAERNKNVGFDMVGFEQHLDGLLSDLVDICTYPPSTRGRLYGGATFRMSQAGFDPYAHKGAVVLCYATADEVRQGEPREWQACAQGYACIEAE